MNNLLFLHSFCCCAIVMKTVFSESYFFFYCFEKSTSHSCKNCIRDCLSEDFGEQVSLRVKFSCECVTRSMEGAYSKNSHRVGTSSGITSRAKDDTLRLTFSLIINHCINQSIDNPFKYITIILFKNTSYYCKHKVSVHFPRSQMFTVFQKQ